MYSFVALPELPVDARVAPSAPALSFVDDDAVQALLHQRRDVWQEQRYIGEDFAGRDDCTLPASEGHTLPQRRAIGPFFASPLLGAPQAVVSSEPAPSTAGQVLPHQRAWTWLSAAALILTAGLCALSAMPGTTTLRIGSQSQADEPTILTAQQSTADARIVIDNRR